MTPAKTTEYRQGSQQLKLHQLSDDRQRIFAREKSQPTQQSEEASGRLRSTPLKICRASNVKIFIEEPAITTEKHTDLSAKRGSSKVSTTDSLSVPQDKIAPRSRLSSLLDEDQLLDHLIEELGGNVSNLQQKSGPNKLGMFRIISRSGNRPQRDPRAPVSMNLDKSTVSNAPWDLVPKTSSAKAIKTASDAPTTHPKLLPPYYMGDLHKVAADLQAGKPITDLESEHLKQMFEHFKMSLHTLRGMGSDTLTDPKEFLKKLEIRHHQKWAEKDISPQPAQLEKPLLVLDLDETLIHKPVQGRVYREDASHLEMKCFIEKDPQGRYFTVYKRPYLQEFLQELAELYTIYVFTASDQRYATAIVNSIDPERKFISRVFDRRFCCTTQDGYLVKDLRIFSRETPLNKITLVDNSSHCFFTQLKNGVPILSFYDQREDRELFHLKKYLQALSKCDDMLARNEDHFQLDKYFLSGKPEIVLQKIFAHNKTTNMLTGK